MRRYITTGDVAHDFAAQKCAESFVVSWGGSFQGVPGQGRSNLSGAPIVCAMPLTAQFTVALLRCVPTLKSRGHAPTVEDLQASGEALMLDAMTLPAVTINSYLNGDLMDRDRHSLGIVQMIAIGPQGGVGGVAMTIIVGMT
jgi:hypothetical protein